MQITILPPHINRSWDTVARGLVHKKEKKGGELVLLYRPDWYQLEWEPHKKDISVYHNTGRLNKMI